MKRFISILVLLFCLVPAFSKEKVKQLCGIELGMTKEEVEYYLIKSDYKISYDTITPFSYTCNYKANNAFSIKLGGYTVDGFEIRFRNNKCYEINISFPSYLKNNSVEYIINKYSEKYLQDENVLNDSYSFLGENNSHLLITVNENRNNFIHFQFSDDIIAAEVLDKTSKYIEDEGI